MNNREKIIENYIDRYNQFDIDKMVADFDDDIEFENISNGNINMLLSGINAFKEQANQAKSYFSFRNQKIKSSKHNGDETEVEIEYYAILAIDFSEDLKKGDELKLVGKSIFKFLNNKIIKLIDIS